jgi:hypothetical protein
MVRFSICSTINHLFWGTSMTMEISSHDNGNPRSECPVPVPESTPVHHSRVHMLQRHQRGICSWPHPPKSLEAMRQHGNTVRDLANKSIYLLYICDIWIYHHDLHIIMIYTYIYITHCIYRYSGGHDIVLWNKTCYLSKVYSEITTSKLLRMSPTWESCKTMVFWQSQKVMIDDTDIWIRWKIYGRGNIPWKPRSFRLSVRYLSIDQSMYICIIYVLYMCASV